MKRIMTTPGLFLIRDNIFGHLSYEDLEICCKVSVSWNESLNENSSLKKLYRKQALVKYLLEFGEKLVRIYPVCKSRKVLEVIPGWDKGVKKVGNKASLDELKEIKESLSNYYDDYDPDEHFIRHPVFWAARKGDLALMKLFFETSFDMNTREDDEDSNTIFSEACAYSESSEMVQLIMRSSKDHGIDLNLPNVWGSPFHGACFYASQEITKLIFENYKEFGIDIIHENEHYFCALDTLIYRLHEEERDNKEDWEEFVSILREEYAKIDKLELAA